MDNLQAVFNFCLNDKYTHTHTHIYMYTVFFFKCTVKQNFIDFFKCLNLVADSCLWHIFVGSW